MASKTKQVVLHPLMFGLYPVAFLYTGHKALFDFSVTYLPAFLSVLFACFAWLLLKGVFGDWDRAAVAASASLMALFSYSSVMHAVQAASEGAELDLWSKIIAGSIVAVIAATVVALRSSKHLSQVNYVLNVVSIFLVASPLFQLAIGGLMSSSLQAAVPDKSEFYANHLPKDAKPGPDIYYFVLDGYGRSDFLHDDFGFDNSAMLDGLAQRGFVVPPKATSNYPFTLLSVNSTLNFTYFNDVFGDQLAGMSDQRFLRELMQDSRAVRVLRDAGYRIATFESEYWGANIGNADDDLKEWWFLNHFNFGVLQMTPIPTLLQAAGYPFLYDLHRVRTAYPFEHIQDAIDLPGPKFVYAHTFVGHPPFVFGANGEKVELSGDYKWELENGNAFARESVVDGYNAQVNYMNKLVLEAVDKILARSDRDPIIIMHGDHGPGLQYDPESLENTFVPERYDIFYAAHLPDGGNQEIYDSITPVNGFRVVFNRYLGTDYEILEDRAYFAPQSRPYQYTRIQGFPETSMPPHELTAASADRPSGGD